MTPIEQRLLSVLPAHGIITVHRAGWRAVLSSGDTKRAAAGLLRADLVLVTVNRRLTPTIAPDALLELTEAGRESQRAAAIEQYV